ncbi:MAG: sigma-54-dependent Fis family transcriptional regulator [Micavibrio sp.]|nr:MAG: sigma-54-dependent Fis family transcriptional regulator [Micavibrio sp.]
MSADILIVDDEADIRNLIQGILEDEGYQTRLAANAQDAYEAIAEKSPDLIVLDIWLQGSEHDGMEMLDKVKVDDPALPVLMISGHGTIETAVSAIKQGAYDFIEKPFKSDRLLLMIKRALETASLKRENEQLRQKSGEALDFIAESPQMEAFKQMLDKAAPTNSRILLTGEPGTGKDLISRIIHKFSDRADQPFLALNCATLHPDRFEAELFGVEGGALGLLEQADSGTLLLDEVSDMPLETQGKIVRVLQEQKFQRPGGSKFIEVDVRIIASTNRDLEQAVKDETFRQDLYYRLNVVPIAIPPLRDHLSDIPSLVEYFAGVISRQSGLSQRTFSRKALSVMQGYEWPGNVRQLRNVIEWVMIMSGPDASEDIKPADLPPEISKMASPVLNSGPNTGFTDLPLREAREVFERNYLLSQVNRFDGNISKTAEFIGMERSAFHRKLKSLQILTTEREETKQENDKRKKA